MAASPNPSGPASSNTAAPPARGRQQACERCWKRKQKCDRLLPTCTGCSESGANCVSRQVDLTTLPEEAVLSHAAVSRYVESLKRKIGDLEQQSQQKRLRRKSNINASPASRDHVSPNTTHASRYSYAGDLVHGSVDATMGEISFLSRSAMAEPRDELGEFPRHLALEEVIMAAIAADGPDPSMSSMRSVSSLLGFMSSDNSDILLRREPTINSMTRFLEQVCILYPHLNPVELKQDYEDTLSDHNSRATNHVMISAPFRDFKVFLAIAIGTLLSPESSRAESFIISLHKNAMKLFPAIVKACNQLQTLYCMILLILYSTYSSSSGSTWHLVGLAMKKCLALRLNKELENQNGLLESEIDERRRIFWSLYLIDRSLGIVMDRPFSIQDDDISLLTLGNEDYPCEHLIMHARLISNIRTEGREEPLFDYGNLRHWRDSSLPTESRQLSAQFQPIYDHFDLLYCRTLIQMIGPLSQRLPQHDKRKQLIGSQSSIQTETISSCEHLIDHIYEKSEHGTFVGSFLDAYDIFSAGVALLCIALGQDQSMKQALVQVTKVVNKCSALLTMIGERFSAVKTFRKVLWALSNKAPGSGLLSSQMDPQDILYNLPPVIPDRIRQLIRCSIREYDNEHHQIRS